LEKSEGKIIDGSEAMEATVRQLPISKGIAGVSMKLAPGAMRELHWHATAAEWAFVDRGRVRTTVLAPGGHTETNDFGPGDVWYFPRGHGHMLECLGNEPCHFVLIFDNGYFSEFGTFSITDSVGHTPKALLAKNFGLPSPPSTVSRRRRCISPRGACRPRRRPSRSLARSRRRRLTSGSYSPTTRSSTTRAADSGWSIPPSSPISKTITGAVLELERGALRELHWHPNADEWQYVLEGKVSITLVGSGGRYRTETLEKGDVGYSPQGHGHSIENISEGKCRVHIGFNSGTYEEIDLSEWVAGNPPDVLATNFGQPASLFEKSPGATSSSHRPRIRAAGPGRPGRSREFRGRVAGMPWPPRGLRVRTSSRGSSPASSARSTRTLPSGPNSSDRNRVRFVSVARLPERSRLDATSP
jgi:oxalate decarboxylase